MKCRSLPAFKPEHLRNGFSKEMINEARKHRKINQVAIVFISPIDRAYPSSVATG
jgi:hypothetical protein